MVYVFDSNNCIITRLWCMNNLLLYYYFSVIFIQTGMYKHCSPRSVCSRSSLICVYTVSHSVCIFWRHFCTVWPFVPILGKHSTILDVRKLRTFMVHVHYLKNDISAAKMIILDEKLRYFSYFCSNIDRGYTLEQYYYICALFSKFSFALIIYLGA